MGRARAVLVLAPLVLAVLPASAGAEPGHTARSAYLGTWVDVVGETAGGAVAGQPLGTASFVALAGEYSVTVAARDVTGLPVAIEVWQRTLHGDLPLGTFCGKSPAVRLNPARTEVVVRVVATAVCSGAAGVPVSGEVLATFRH
ncbi:MAG: hypothetical protein QOJ79_3508 [Actinomycetota bacterium]|jgi:hypothetical protein|nr:hypothetical protein [Actinomycetota bacterium]